MDAAASLTSSSQHRGESARWRMVCLCAEQPQWTALALQLADAGLNNPRIEWVDSAPLLMECLRSQSYEAVILEHATSADTSTWNTSQIVTGLRGGGYAAPIIVLIRVPADELLARLSEYDCEALVSLSPWNSPALWPMIQRAIHQFELRQSHHDLTVELERRKSRDQLAVSEIMQRQQSLLQSLVETSDLDHSSELRQSYRDLLQSRILNGPADRCDELNRLAELFARTDAAPPQILALHTEVVQQILQGLGEESSRQVLARCDRLGLELMTQLASAYHHR